MSDNDDAKPVIADQVSNVTLSGPVVVGRGFMTYERYDISIRRDGEPALVQQRDVLRASRVVAVLPIDLARDQIVLIRQFRLPAHLATGRGEMIEIVAGRVEQGEAPSFAASRECLEEISVAPDRLVELYSVLPTPGFTDEYVTFFLGFVDAAKVPARAGAAEENEDTRPFVVSIDDALAALGQGRIFNGLVISALQWLALHRTRLREYYERADRIDAG